MIRLYSKLAMKIKRNYTETGQGVPTVDQQIMNSVSIHEDAGSMPGLTQWIKDPAMP